jgi:nitrite reductase/ring-hydroxylating ferredoxin subunit
MTLPASSLIRAAHAASRSMADRTTPFIFNEWYVAAFTHQIDRSLRKRKILGRNLVFFRTTDGKPVALEDRCAHRSYPLSASKLDGNTIVCGYHGLRYDEVRTAHIPTPESLTSTHYFIVHGRDFALSDPGVTQFMHDQLFQAFTEDVVGLAAVEQTFAAAGEKPYEISLPSDRASVAMRRYLKRRSDEEHSGQSDAQAG